MVQALKAHQAQRRTSSSKTASSKKKVPLPQQTTSPTGTTIQIHEPMGHNSYSSHTFCPCGLSQLLVRDAMDQEMTCDFLTSGER